MTYEITASEYLELGIVPLSTPAWATEDISSLLAGPPARGTDLVIPGRPGQIARPRVTDARTVTIPLTVFGDYDWEGNAYADRRLGLMTNLEHLKLRLAPPLGTDQRNLTWYSPAGDRRAKTLPESAIDISMLGTHTARVVITLTIPSGLLRGVNDTVETLTGSGTLTIAGTALVTDHIITTSGSASTFEINNTSTGNKLIYNASHSALTFDCGAYTLTGGNAGAVTTTGTALWLPLRPGNNALTLTGTTSITITYKAAWL
jgi:phage-related protein